MGSDWPPRVYGGQGWDAGGCDNRKDPTRLIFVQQKPIKVLCRELNLSRKVVRKVIRLEATEFNRGATLSSSRNRTPSRKSSRKLLAALASLSNRRWRGRRPASVFRARFPVSTRARGQLPRSRSPN